MAMASFSFTSSSSSSILAFKVKNCSIQRQSVNPKSTHLPTANFKKELIEQEHPWQKELQKASLRMEIPRGIIKDTFIKLLDTFVDSLFQFHDQPLLPSQRNFGPVEELNEAIAIVTIEGKIPSGFPPGVYIRNGPNPLFGGLKWTKSVFGRSSHSWIEGEGMLHALYFDKQGRDGTWNLRYNNKYVDTDTFKMEKRRNRPSFLPAIEGDSPAIVSAFLLNLLRFGKTDKYMSNTNVFEHAGKYYSIAENHLPQEIDIHTLKTLSNWDVNGAWNKAFTSHPKKAPGTGELVIIGVSPMEPFMELGVISADGKKLVHKVDLKLNRCSLCHEIGVTKRYNVIMDLPLTIDLSRLLRGGPLIKFNKGEYTRIGVVPRYGSAKEVRWFDVEPCAMFHIFNCYEDEHDRVVIRGCRGVESIIPGPDFGLNKFEWFSKRMKLPQRWTVRSDSATTLAGDHLEEDTSSSSLLSHAYEWTLDMKNGEVNERNLTASNFCMDFPLINPDFTGISNKFGYAQVVNASASSTSGMVKYGGVAKLHFNKSRVGFSQENSRCEVEYHIFDDEIFCTGAVFVPKQDRIEEDDGWLVTFVHNEHTDVSQVYLIDAKNISKEPIAKITLPERVPYGFHGTYIHL